RCRRGGRRQRGRLQRSRRRARRPDRRPRVRVAGRDLFRRSHGGRWCLRWRGRGRIAESDDRQERSGRGRRRRHRRRGAGGDRRRCPGAGAPSMNRILLVTQSARAVGEFRRPCVRAAYKRFVARHRRAVTEVCARLAAEGEVTVMAARELIERAALPSKTEVRYYDEEIYKLDADDVLEIATTLADRW